MKRRDAGEYSADDLFSVSEGEGWGISVTPKVIVEKSREWIRNIDGY